MRHTHHVHRAQDFLNELVLVGIGVLVIIVVMFALAAR